MRWGHKNQYHVLQRTMKKIKLVLHNCLWLVVYSNLSELSLHKHDKHCSDSALWDKQELSDYWQYLLQLHALCPSIISSPDNSLENLSHGLCLKLWNPQENLKISLHSSGGTGTLLLPPTDDAWYGHTLMWSFLQNMALEALKCVAWKAFEMHVE